MLNEYNIIILYYVIKIVEHVFFVFFFFFYVRIFFIIIIKDTTRVFFNCTRKLGRLSIEFFVSKQKGFYRDFIFEILIYPMYVCDLGYGVPLPYLEVDN